MHNFTEVVDDVIPFKNLRYVTDFPSRNNNIRIRRANGTFGYISRPHLRNNTHSGKRKRQTLENEEVDQDEYYVENGNTDSDIEDSNSAHDSHDDNIPPQNSRNESDTPTNNINNKIPFYKRSEAKNEQHSKILYDYVMQPHSSEPYGIWDTTAVYFEYIKKPLRSTTERFATFTFGMVLFGLCVHLLIEGSTDSCLKSLLNIYAPLVGPHFYDHFPRTADQLNQMFWNMIGIPKVERQFIDKLVDESNRYIDHGVARTHVSASTSDFTMFDVRDIIKLQLNDPIFLNDLKNGIKRTEAEMNTSENDRVYEQLEDGDVIRKLRKNGPLKWWNIYSFQVFFDGVRLFKSGNTKMVAVYLVNTLIPYEQRFRPGNVIVLAIISSKCKIKYGEFVETVVKKFKQDMQLNGADLSLNSMNIKIGGLITNLVCDIKERECLLQMNGGFYRCLYCYTKGTTGDHKHVTFPVNNETIKKRTNASFRLDSRFGKKFPIILTFIGDDDKPMRGLKGRSALLDLDEFDPVKMTPVEVMHTFDMGIIKYFLGMWTTTCVKYKDTGYKLDKASITEIERRVDAIRLPHYISRRPKFADRDSWKAMGNNHYVIFTYNDYFRVSNFCFIHV